MENNSLKLAIENEQFEEVEIISTTGTRINGYPPF